LPSDARPAHEADPMKKQTVLQVKNLSKSFPGVHALSDMKLEVESGSVHALMGENGAGKSTLMKILAGFYPPDTGEVLYKGNLIRLRSPHDAIAAVVIGGTSLSGGVGGVRGTILGALLMGVINNGLDLMNVSSYYQQIIKGAIIVGAVWLDQSEGRAVA
jgi:energy-coupling factor transporter ATP-binding protein EcfA2